MQETRFRNWLTAVRRLKERAAANRVADCKRVERHEGDLDDQWDADGLDGLLERLTYSREDERTGRPPKHRVPIAGNIYNGTATLKAAARRYREFRDSTNRIADASASPAKQRRGEPSAHGAVGGPSGTLGRREPRTNDTTCFAVFKQCVHAVDAGDLIQSVSARDKEFHFQNWFQYRLEQTGTHFEAGGRNSYPDFSIVEHAEGYEVKGLAWPGRVRNYDANSQMPTGRHNGRSISYVFGRYPADLETYPDHGGGRQYPVIDLVMCHGSFLNADHGYIHKNKSVEGFGTYGDVLIRDRKMYVAPTPFALTEGTTGLMTLIAPEEIRAPDGFRRVGGLSRTEAAELVVAYRFDLRTNELAAERVPNPHAAAEHRFAAYRLDSQAAKPVTMSTQAPGGGA